eukprot:TRINITY_DN3525_c0_g1_i3.p2 TRINITY_DN3525_c0_g1~~TRINITY_DN3525_c0_g1_i3.p2  ORF type:complete len:204 (-),score=-16.46 TRINITY_DN3525_c0_g1_i3:86-697(-)
MPKNHQKNYENAENAYDLNQPTIQTFKMNYNSIIQTFIYRSRTRQLVCKTKINSLTENYIIIISMQNKNQFTNLKTIQLNNFLPHNSITRLYCYQNNLKLFQSRPNLNILANYIFKVDVITKILQIIGQLKISGGSRILNKAHVKFEFRKKIDQLINQILFNQAHKGYLERSRFLFYQIQFKQILSSKFPRKVLFQMDMGNLC